MRYNYPEGNDRDITGEACPGTAEQKARLLGWMKANILHHQDHMEVHFSVPFVQADLPTFKHALEAVVGSGEVLYKPPQSTEEGFNITCHLQPLATQYWRSLLAGLQTQTDDVYMPSQLAIDYVGQALYNTLIMRSAGRKRGEASIIADFDPQEPTLSEVHLTQEEMMRGRLERILGPLRNTFIEATDEGIKVEFRGAEAIMFKNWDDMFPEKTKINSMRKGLGLV
jgi:hypothetical protein